jgi:hypothetical protein
VRQVTFSEDGPLGIVWSQVLEGQRIDYSYIKSVRPASQAAAQPDCVAGLVLGYIDGAWCQNADYDATIEIIRAAGRPGPPRPAPGIAGRHPDGSAPRGVGARQCWPI